MALWPYLTLPVLNFHLGDIGVKHIKQLTAWGDRPDSGLRTFLKGASWKSGCNIGRIWSISASLCKSYSFPQCVFIAVSSSRALDSYIIIIHVTHMLYSNLAAPNIRLTGPVKWYVFCVYLLSPNSSSPCNLACSVMSRKLLYTSTIRRSSTDWCFSVEWKSSYPAASSQHLLFHLEQSLLAFRCKGRRMPGEQRVGEAYQVSTTLKVFPWVSA